MRKKRKREDKMSRKTFFKKLKKYKSFGLKFKFKINKIFPKN